MKNATAVRMAKTVLVLGVAVAGLVTPAATTTAVADEPSPAKLPLRKIEMEYGKAVFDLNRNIFDVCDTRKDEHAVYAYFSADTDALYYDREDGGCDRRASPRPWEDMGDMWVCEDIPYWKDNCAYVEM